MERKCDSENHVNGRVVGWNISCLSCGHKGFYNRDTKEIDWTTTAYKEFNIELLKRLAFPENMVDVVNNSGE